MHGATALATEVKRAVDVAWVEMADRVELWVAEYGQSNQELTASDCFDGPVTFGYQYQCGNCGGRGENQCTRCFGHGSYTCSGCQGDGQNRCFTCGGSGSRQCSTCGGRGSNMVQQSRQVYNSATNSYQTEYYNEYQSCTGCGGSGRYTCGGCGGSGRTTCSICFGSGKERCGPCGGSGTITCSTCSGTGTRNETQTVSCSVAHRWQVIISDPNTEVNSRLGRLNLGELAHLGQVSVDQPEWGREFLERRYRFTVDIAELTVGVAEQQVELTGFGKEAKVYDFKNIAGLLLQADLTRLQGEVAKEPKFAMQRSPALKEAVKQ